MTPRVPYQSVKRNKVITSILKLDWALKSVSLEHFQCREIFACIALAHFLAFPGLCLSENGLSKREKDLTVKHKQVELKQKAKQ